MGQCLGVMLGVGGHGSSILVKETPKPLWLTQCRYRDRILDSILAKKLLLAIVEFDSGIVICYSQACLVGMTQQSSGDHDGVNHVSFLTCKLSCLMEHTHIVLSQEMLAVANHFTMACAFI